MNNPRTERSMEAAVLHAAGTMSLEQIPIPSPGPSEVLLKITGAGLCGSDASFYTRGIEAFPPDKRGAWPVVPGHEFAGEVVERGRDVTGLDVGDLVACGAGVSCGTCRNCVAGRTNLCRVYKTLGAHFNGGLAQYCVAPADTCIPAAPYGTTGDDVALAQPMAVAHHAVARAGVASGDRVLVVGSGGVGAFAVWAASQRGASVSVTDIAPDRLAIARTLGAGYAFAFAGDETLQDAAEGDGWDIVIESTGVPSSLELALAGARPGSTIVQLGLHKVPPALPLQRTTLEEIDLVGTYAHVCSVDIPAALGLLADRTEGWADIAPTVTPLRDVVADALVPMIEGTSDRIKALIDPFIESARPYRR